MLRMHPLNLVKSTDKKIATPISFPPPFILSSNRNSPSIFEKDLNKFARETCYLVEKFIVGGNGTWKRPTRII